MIAITAAKIGRSIKNLENKRHVSLYLESVSNAAIAETTTPGARVHNQTLLGILYRVRFRGDTVGRL